MPVCRFFSSPRGCGRGAQCHYQHILPDTQEQLGSTPHPNLRVAPITKANDNVRTGFATSSFPRPDPLAQIACHFFKIGQCKNGDKCRFRHDIAEQAVSTPAEESRVVPGSEQNGQDVTRPESSKAIESTVRNLGGTLVTFGPGAEVISIHPTVNSIARLQMCTVNCSWYKPTKTATLEFKSTKLMEQAAKKLRQTKVLDRTLTCRTAVNKKTKPWHCIVTVSNLNVLTTIKMLKEACERSATVTFGELSYSSSSEAIGQVIHRLLSSVGKIESWTVTPDARNDQFKATATFLTMEQATKAITDFNGYRLPQLGGSKILLSHFVKAKFSILSSIFSAISPELAELKRTFRMKNRAEIKTYPSVNGNRRFTTLHILSHSVREVGKAKMAVGKIINGHTAKGGKDYIWNDFFLKPEGLAYLNNLGKEHNVFVYCNVQKSILSLYGKAENNAVVESVLLKAVEDLTGSTFLIELDGKVSEAEQQARYRKVVEKLGKATVRLDIKTTSKAVTIHGSSDDADWARIVLQQDSGQSTDNGKDIENTICVVCWCDVTEPYTTPCSHIYDKECFVSQCLAAGDGNIPIRCLGSSGSCQAILSFEELASVLTRDCLEKLLDRSFRRYVRTNSERYQYCPTADCDQVYKISEDAELYTCSTCLTSICTKCRVISHEGLTCEEYKIDNEALEEWKRENGAKNCPKCEITIQKSEGCNHIQCRGCGAHICWVCLRVFDRAQETYDHMSADHNGFYDARSGGDPDDGDNAGDGDDAEDSDDGGWDEWEEQIERVVNYERNMFPDHNDEPRDVARWNDEDDDEWV